jgi:phosphoglucosamine mutase
LEELYFSGRFCYATGPEIGGSWREDASWEYLQFLHSLFAQREKHPFKGVKVVVDTANGATYRVAPLILEELGAEVVQIGNEPDGTNINKGVGALYPQTLAEKVREVGADLGIALDGDGDRLVVVDEKGEVVNGDHLIGGLATHLHQKGKLRGGVVVTIMSNVGLEHYLNRLGIKVWRAPVGDRNVLELMEKVGSNFGGEQSGHLIFRDYANTGDGILSSLFLIKWFVEEGKPISQLLNLFPLLPQLQSALPVSEKIPLEEIEGLLDLLEELRRRKIRPVIRYSGTENKLRILLEGEDPQLLRQEMEKIETFFRTRLK